MITLQSKIHLDSYYERLAKRYDKGRTPYNLRNCAYHEDFTKEKLLWMEHRLTTGRFAYSDNTERVLRYNKGFMMTGGPLKYLCADPQQQSLDHLANETHRGADIDGRVGRYPVGEVRR